MKRNYLVMVSTEMWEEHTTHYSHGRSQPWAYEGDKGLVPCWLPELDRAMGAW